MSKDKVFGFLPLSLSEKGHTFVKKPNRVIALSQVVTLVVVNKCVKFMK